MRSTRTLESRLSYRPEALDIRNFTGVRKDNECVIFFPSNNIDPKTRVVVVVVCVLLSEARKEESPGNVFRPESINRDGSWDKGGRVEDGGRRIRALDIIKALGEVNEVENSRLRRTKYLE